MSLKIEPFNDEFENSENTNTKEIELNETQPEIKYKFLQKPNSASLKLKKSCSARTCSGENFHCRQILPEQRSLIINQFWIEMDADARLKYITQNAEYFPEKLESDKFLYNLTINSQTYSVCKKMFISTLSLIEKNLNQVLIDNNENKRMKNVAVNKKSAVKLKTEKPSIQKKENMRKRSGNKKTNAKENISTIEYVEVNPDLDNLNENDSESDVKSNKKKPIKRSRISKKPKKNLKKPKYPTKYEQMSDVEDEDSDESWNAGIISKESSSESDFEEENIREIKVEKRLSSRNASITASHNPPIKKPKIEPQSDIENVISSSDDDNFSNVEDTDDSDVEDKAQPDSRKDKEFAEYSNGITIPKKMGDTCSSSLCPKITDRKCKIIKQYQREHIFDEFWNKKSLYDRRYYVKQNVEVLEEKGRPKSITPLIYNLTIGIEKFQVCQRMFHSTLALQNSCVYNWVYDRNPKDKFDENDISNILDPLDTPKTLKARKRFENYTEKLQLLEDFLNSLEKMPQKSFPQQKSHKHYLTEKIEGLRNLQQLYKATMKIESVPNPLPVKILKKVFCAKHYTFYTGYKKKYAKFKTIDDTEITPELELAMKRDQQERQRDKILTKKPGSNIIVLDIDTCDGKVSPNWNGDGDYSEPNSRLCCFNLTVSNVITLHTYNYWFCEIDALDTTPSSFITCLMDYFTNFCPNAKQIIIYCRIGDERFKNIDMTNALLDYGILNNVAITQKFYIPRKHLYKDETECQAIYRSLYRKLRRFEINLPSDYITATVDCKREAMEAKWFHFNQFRDYSSKSEKHRYINLCDDSEEIDKIKSIITKQDGTVSIKMDFDDDWDLLPNSLKCKPSMLSEWPQLSYDRRKISAIKYQLLQSLKVKLPRDCHFFYDYLTIEI